MTQGSPRGSCKLHRGVAQRKLGEEYCAPPFKYLIKPVVGKRNEKEGGGGQHDSHISAAADESSF